MNRNWSMPQGLKIHYHQALEAYRLEMATGNVPHAWRQLERAHIIGQPWLVQHTHVHWLMLKFGIRIKDSKEIIGQLPRLLVGGIKSFVGKIPTGNTGGANVPPFKVMEIPEELDTIMKPYRNV